jgi:hypothetical protein
MLDEEKARRRRTLQPGLENRREYVTFSLEEAVASAAPLLHFQQPSRVVELDKASIRRSRLLDAGLLADEELLDALKSYHRNDQCSVD